MGLIPSMLATKPPLRVTATGPSTHVVEVNSISKLREKYCTLYSPTFTVDGLDWKILLQLDREGDAEGYIGVLVELATDGAVAWARLKIGLVDWTTGRADTFFPDDGDGEFDDPVLFDAGSDFCCNSGTTELASWERQLRGSSRRYLCRDCLRIECVIDVCRSDLAFPDPPPHVEVVTGELGSHDVLILPADDDAEPVPAHSAVLAAYAPRFLEMLRPPAAATQVNADGGMPRQDLDALLRFIYTGTLPVVAGLSADGYRNMFWNLMIASEMYDMRRLSAICGRVLCNSIDIQSSAAMLTMAHQHGFQEIKEACVEFMSDPDNYGSVLKSKGYAKLIMSLETFSLVKEIWEKYCKKERRPSPLLR